ncbi:hypothetical protein [[Eubacterium] hominis]|uniref:hypothetical protein n=1 Tax=[Eubacterium] hominis TaxID=2764325 RepID=UPI003A4DC4F4
MKKSTLLSLATAGAIVATSVGTFAAWDVTQVTTETKSLTLGKAVVVQATSGNLTKDVKNNLNNDEGESINGDITVDLSSVDTPLQTNRSLEITPNVNFKNGDAAIADVVEGTDYTVEVKKADKVLTSTGGVVTDDSIDTFDANTNKYTIVVTPKNSTKLSEKTIEISATIELK